MKNKVHNMNSKQLLRDERELLPKPGDTIVETLEALKMSQAELAARMGKTTSKVNDIISGKEPITYNTALQLERVLNINAQFWLNLEIQYREKLARLDLEEQLEKHIDWMKQHPVRELKANGYISAQGPDVSVVEDLLRFYGVVSPDQWHRVYLHNHIKKSYCKTSEGKREVSYVTTWMRIGELESKKLDLPDFDKPTFRRLLASIRNWSSHHPDEVKTELQNVCAKAGVALIINSFNKLPAKGVTRWVAGNPVIQVSTANARKPRDFWSIFYHAVAHVMLHGRKEIFIDDFDGFKANREKEEEAEKFVEKWIEG